jgi:hypothetical protein
MHSLRLAVVVSIVAGTAATAAAADIHVPQDVPNLKDVLLTAQPGDRVIVTGGVWRNGRVLSDVTVVGRMGATLTGLWEIQGAGATVEGFAVRSGSIEIQSDDVTLRRNRFSARKYTVMLTGSGISGTTLEDNRFSYATAQIEDSTGLVARGNRFSVGELIVFGNGTTADGNVFVRNAQLGVHDGSGAVVTGNDGGQIHVSEMANATVSRNRVRGAALYVRGAGALVTDNEVTAGRGLYVTGDDASVLSNVVRLRSGQFGVRGDRALVLDNVVDNLASRSARIRRDGVFAVNGAGPSSVRRNEVRHVMSVGMRLECSGTEIASNSVRGERGAQSMTVGGSGNNVHDNTLTVEDPVDDLASALVVSGDGNVVADTSVAGSGYDGVAVESGAGNLIARVHVERTGRCGITVGENATDTGVADCVVDGARWASLYVLGTDTTITGGSFTGGRKVDVLDLGTGTEFVSTSFATKSESEGLRPFR